MNNPRVQRTLILVFGLFTALVHLWLFYGGMSRGRPMYLFLANGVGYLILVGAFFLTQSYKDQVRSLVHYLFMAYAAATLVAWVIMNGGRFQLALSIADKAVEILLIAVLWLHLRATQKHLQTSTT